MCVFLPFGGLLLWLSRFPPFSSIMWLPSGPLCHRLHGLYRQGDDFWAAGLRTGEYRGKSSDLISIFPCDSSSGTLFVRAISSCACMFTSGGIDRSGFQVEGMDISRNK